MVLALAGSRDDERATEHHDDFMSHVVATQTRTHPIGADQRRTRFNRLAVRSLLAAGVACLVAALVGVANESGSAFAADSVTCHRWVSATGSDSNDGSTEARAVASFKRLGHVLLAGETGCLPAGKTYLAHGGLGVLDTVSSTAAKPITITSGPGGRAIVKGGVLFTSNSHDVVFSNLDFRGDGYTKIALHIEGSRIKVTGLDMTHGVGICIGVGKIDQYSHQYNGIEAQDVLISDNRIHHCGTDASMAPNWADAGFSGSHGIYIVNARNTKIVENAIYSNKYRGIQTYPRGINTVIERNVLDGNATQVNLGSVLTEGYPWRTSGTVIRNNVFSNRVTDFRTDKNESQVHGYMPSGTPADGNIFAGNCVVAEAGPDTTGNGIAVGANHHAVARYVNRSAADFRQTADSPCSGYGPSWSQPAASTTTTTTAVVPVATSSSEPVVRCAAGTATVQLATNVTTPSGTPQWAFSVLYHRVNGGQWNMHYWFAAYANNEQAQSWQYAAPGVGWVSVGTAVTLPVTNGSVEVWELRYDLVGGQWQTHWHSAGNCTV